VSVHDSCMVCAKHTISLEIFLDAPNGTLGDEAQVEARFGLFGGSTKLDPRQVNGLPRTYYRLRNLSGCTR
jgi:hypothetical protein